MRINLIPIALIFLFQLVFAQKQNNIVFERRVAGSKELSKGNAVVADSSAFSAVYWNPGVLAFRRDLSLAAHGEKNPNRLHKTGGSFGVENGVGNRMGIGTSLLFINDFMLGYAGLGYRLSKTDGIGTSLSVIYDMEDEYQSPLAFDFGWFRFWSEKWQSGLQVRNLGFNSRATAIEAGITHRNLLLSKPASVSLSVVNYQVADTTHLPVFDPDLYVLKGKFGFEWRAFASGDLRLGIDGKKPAIGWGYIYNLDDKIVLIDYAWPLSLTARIKF
ncbi:hypothetical protein R83H12_02954 [Fibrobacteria bacterium R8-3-H12]